MLRDCLPGASARSAASIAAWLIVAMYASIAFDIAGIVSGFLQLDVLEAIRVGRFSSEALMNEAAESNDVRHQALGWIQVVSRVCAMALFLVWVYRSARLAAAIEGGRTRFTPGWAIGWNFVPVANLWKPYQVIKEFWIVTRRAVGRSTEPIPYFFPLWWAAWIAANVVGRAAQRYSLRAETASELVGSTMMQMAADFVTMLAFGLALVVVKGIVESQKELAQTNAPMASERAPG